MFEYFGLTKAWFSSHALVWEGSEFLCLEYRRSLRGKLGLSWRSMIVFVLSTAQLKIRLILAAVSR